jgi:endoglycosylceramidase
VRTKVSARACLVASLTLSCWAGGACVTVSAQAGPRGPGAGSAWPVGPLSHAGRWLTDAAGRVVLLHGVNMVEKQAPYYPSAFGFSDQDASFLAANGLYLVRLGVLATGLMPRPGQLDQSYLDHLAATVQDLARHHVFVLLDLHQDGFGPSVGSDGFPPWMTLTGTATNNHVGFPLYYTSDPATQQAFQSLWDDSRVPGGRPLQQYVAQMVQALARRFAHDPAVVGYDVFNEPWPGTTWVPCLAPSGCPSLDRMELDPFYARVDRALRSVDHRHLLLVEPFSLFNLGAATSVSLPASDPLGGLSFHQYALSPQGAAQVLSNAISWSSATGGALVATEWGASTDAAAIASQAGQLDLGLVPWAFWAFTEELVSDLSRAPTGANVVASTRQALVRPYPLVVAGTPLSVSYDPATRQLAASWSTLEPDGRRAAEGAQTTVEVPPFDYPGGYSAEALGARVVSGPCSPLLRLRALPGARTVTLSVRPGGRCSAGP